MSAKALIISAVTIAGLGAVVALNAAEARTAPGNMSRTGTTNRDVRGGIGLTGGPGVEQHNPASSGNLRHPGDGLPGPRPGAGAGEGFQPRPHRPQLMAPVGDEQRPDLSDQWSDDHGWDGAWDDDVQRGPRPTGSPRPRHGREHGVGSGEDGNNEVEDGQ